MIKQEEERKRKDEEERIKKEEDAKKAAAKTEVKKEKREEKKDEKIKDEKKEETGPANQYFSICPKVKCTCIDSMLKPIEDRMDKVLGTSIDPFTGYKHIINKLL